MTELLELIIVIVVIWAVFNCCRLIYKRAFLVGKLKTLKSTANAEIRYAHSPLRSLFRLSDKPEIVIKIGNVLYLIRMYNGGGIGNVVHFASERYTVRFSRMRTASYSRGKMRQRPLSAKRGFAIGSKVIPLEKLNTDMMQIPVGLRTEEVLIFNPAPGELSYVSEQKNSIKVAFTGDKVYGIRVFTASTFVSYAEREYRRLMEDEGKKKTEEQREYSYFFD